MTSIRKQVFEYCKMYPKASVKEAKKEFKERPTNTIGTYFRQYHRTRDSIRNDTLDIKAELKKIIKDYKQPASARVQAIREYNNLVEITPESSDDPLLKLLTTLEKES